MLLCGLSVFICLSNAILAQDAKTPARPAAAAWPADKPTAPTVLPGNGLAQHDFFYAGEAKAQNMYIIRKGQIVWRYEDAASKGEISDGVVLSNGNILFAHQFGVTLITPERKVIWNYEAPPKTETHTAVPIGKERVLFIQNGDPAKLLVMNIVSGKTEKESTLPVGNPKSVHGQFRHARLTDAGTVLVAHMDMKKVCEYDENGKEIWSVDAPGVWGASRLKNGNTLMSLGRSVREVNGKGETVWEFAASDIPDYKVTQFQLATRLSNGNTLINNWVNQWSTKIDPVTAPAQAWEISADKKVVWALRSWVDPTNLGPATTIQILDEPGAPEDVRFGEIK
jgi:outer membrane protein assembly factor BamB